MPATVLIADDDPDILDLIAALLAQEGFQTVAFSDGLAALHAIRTQRPALAIIDLAMPVLDGRELIERLRKEPGEPLPVIAMSASISAPPPDQLQADAYLAKPFDLEELLEHVKYLANRSSEPAIAGADDPPSLAPVMSSSAVFYQATHSSHPEDFYRESAVPFTREKTGEKTGDAPTQSGYTLL